MLHLHTDSSACASTSKQFNGVAAPCHRSNLASCGAFRVIQRGSVRQSRHTLGRLRRFERPT